MLYSQATTASRPAPTLSDIVSHPSTHHASDTSISSSKSAAKRSVAVDFPALGQSQPIHKPPILLARNIPSKSKEVHSAKRRETPKSSKNLSLGSGVTSKISTLQISSNNVNVNVNQGQGDEVGDIIQRESNSLWRSREKLEWNKEKKNLSLQLKWMIEERDQLSQLLNEQDRVKLVSRIEELEVELHRFSGLLMDQEKIIEEGKDGQKKAEETTTKVLTEVAKCTLCLDIYRDPYVLTCGHLACKQCLAAWFSTTSAYRTKICPVCRSPISQRPIRIYHFHAIYEGVGIEPQKADSDSDGKDSVDPWRNLFPSTSNQFSPLLAAIMRGSSIYSAE